MHSLIQDSIQFPHGDAHRCSGPNPWNLQIWSCRERDFTDVIKDLEMPTGEWILCVGLE